MRKVGAEWERRYVFPKLGHGRFSPIALPRARTCYVPHSGPNSTGTPLKAVWIVRVGVVVALPAEGVLEVVGGCCPAGLRDTAVRTRSGRAQNFHGVHFDPEINRFCQFPTCLW